MSICGVFKLASFGNNLMRQSKTLLPCVDAQIPGTRDLLDSAQVHRGKNTYAVFSRARARVARLDWHAFRLAPVASPMSDGHLAFEQIKRVNSVAAFDNGETSWLKR